MRQKSVQNLETKSYNVTAAMTHIYKQIYQYTIWNNTEYTGQHDIS